MLSAIVDTEVQVHRSTISDQMGIEIKDRVDERRHLIERCKWHLSSLMELPVDLSDYDPRKYDDTITKHKRSRSWKRLATPHKLGEFSPCKSMHHKYFVLPPFHLLNFLLLQIYLGWRGSPTSTEISDIYWNVSKLMDYLSTDDRESHFLLLVLQSLSFGI